MDPEIAGSSPAGGGVCARVLGSVFAIVWRFLCAFWGGFLSLFLDAFLSSRFWCVFWDAFLLLIPNVLTEEQVG